DELKTLASLDIAKLNLDVSKTAEKDNGNYIGLKSTYESTDGSSHAAADVWFVAQNPASVPVAEPDMRTRVVDLVQAIAAFEEGSKQVATSEANKLPVDSAGGALAAAANSTVEQMSDMLKQFDANGQFIGSAGDALVATDQQLKLNGLANTNVAGILAIK
ncbi:MAG: heme utilization protein, partial [Burkholderiales bacterium]|nr:heme utilization protein [Burkholderiales bacterium]